MRAHDFKGSIGATVVNADNLEVAIRLIANAGQTLVEKCLGVVRGNNNGDKTRGVALHISHLCWLGTRVCYDSKGTLYRKGDSTVTFNKSTNTLGHVVQVFDAGASEVFRLVLPRETTLELNRIEVMVNDRTVHANMRALHTLASNGLRLPVLSIELERGCRAFEVRMGTSMLARMTPQLYRQLIAERDFAMVNPAIDGAYRRWVAQHDALIAKHAAAMDEFIRTPLFSIIVPLYQTPIPYFHDMIRSVLAQTYPNWELILVNASPGDEALDQAIAKYRDSRIRVIELANNYGIAGNTNEGIHVATGDYISFFDHDDTLDPHILAFYSEAINDNPDIDLLYCDEDNFHESLKDRYSPLLKPDFNLDLLYSHNYIVHMLTISRYALEQVELSPHNTSGAQDYDLTLKTAEVARTIMHIPYILYHWRAHAGSTNGGVMSSKPYAIAASIEALNAHFNRRGIVAEVSATDITCVFHERYACKPCRIDVLSPTASDDELRALVNHLAIFERNGAVRVGRASNALWSYVKLAAPYTLVCSPSVRFTDNHPLEILAGCLSRPEVGIVAPKLFYLDGLVQHAGVVLDKDNTPQFLNQNFTAHMGGGYHGYAECSCNYPAVGPECFLIRTDLLNAFLNNHTIDPISPAEALIYTDAKPSLTTMLELCESVHGAGRLITVLPTVAAYVDAPVIWAGCPVEQAYPDPHERMDRNTDPTLVTRQYETNGILANPNISFTSGYPQLNVIRNREASIKRMVRGSKYAGAIQPIKRLLGR